MKPKPQIVLVHPSRLHHGDWEGETETRTNQGDIQASHSCDRIPDGKIRTPFEWNGNLMVATGGRFCKDHKEYSAYKLVILRLFDGEPTAYMKKGKHDQWESARNDPLGFYHGMVVKWKGEEYALVGPEVRFVGDPSVPGPVKQMEMELT